jgi:hypothetical protein
VSRDDEVPFFMEGGRNVYRVLLRKHVRNRSHGRLKRRRDDGIKLALRKEDGGGMD